MVLLCAWGVAAVVIIGLIMLVERRASDDPRGDDDGKEVIDVWRLNELIEAARLYRAEPSKLNAHRLDRILEDID